MHVRAVGPPRRYGPTAFGVKSCMVSDLVQTTGQGLYCPQGNFFIDPWQPVERAVISHGHRDHLCEGCQSYLTTSAGQHVLRARLNPTAHIDTLAYGESVVHNGVRITL